MKSVVLAVLVGCGTPSTSSNDLESIPKAASATLRRLAGDAKIERVGREREGGVEVFEATWHVNGLEREAVVTASGEVVEIEEEVESRTVPVQVRGAAMLRLEGAPSIKFVKLKSGNYEAEAIVDGREQEATFFPDGRAVLEDDDDGDDDD